MSISHMAVSSVNCGIWFTLKRDYNFLAKIVVNIFYNNKQKLALNEVRK